MMSRLKWNCMNSTIPLYQHRPKLDSTLEIVYNSFVQLWSYPFENRCFGTGILTISPSFKVQSLLPLCPYNFWRICSAFSKFTSFGATPIDLWMELLYKLVNSGNTSTQIFVFFWVMYRAIFDFKVRLNLKTSYDFRKYSKKFQKIPTFQQCHFW